MTRHPLLSETPGHRASAASILAAHRAAGAETLRDVPVGLLGRSPFQPRRIVLEDEAFNALVDSIREHGVIQPIHVRETDSGVLELLAGERRLKASTLAGRVTIPTRVWHGLSDLDAHALALTENLARVDLTAWEEASALQSLQALRARRNEPTDVRALAQSVGRGKTHVADLLLIAERIRPLVLDGERDADMRLERCTNAVLMRAAKVADPAARAAMMAQLMGRAPPRARVPSFVLRGDASSAMVIRINQHVATLSKSDATTLLTALLPLVGALRAVIDGPDDASSAP